MVLVQIVLFKIGKMKGMNKCEMCLAPISTVCLPHTISIVKLYPKAKCFSIYIFEKLKMQSFL